MRPWFRGRGTALIAFALITLLVVGGLGWVTLAALRLETEQVEARFEVDIRRALWRLESKAFTAIAAEANRPYHDYAVSRSSVELSTKGKAPIQVWKLIPNDPPSWVREQYMIFRTRDWQPSPASINAALGRALGIKPNAFLPPDSSLASSVHDILTQVALVATGEASDPAFRAAMQQPAPNEFTQSSPQSLDRDTQARLNQAVVNRSQGGGQIFLPVNESVSIGVPTPKWHRNVTEMQLVVSRDIQIGERSALHATLIDWPALQEVLAAEVKELLPEIELHPATERTEASLDRIMTALPVEVDPGAGDARNALTRWTPLRIGLALSWVAALTALVAVGLGGWSLLSLSERRIRFVSAVTHELRTPLTTLRLYLDMLASGLVKDEKQKSEYIQTLNTEADRLNRLVGNVLDFSRLENQRPRLEMSSISADELLDQVRSDWDGRCRSAGKELMIQNELGAVALHTDVSLVSQILGNLIDNACKYSQGAADSRIWLRARKGGDKTLYLEVEDCGAGVPLRERSTIFRPFRRGNNENVSAGGVGLGLALARQWAKLLGGDVTVSTGQDNVGACFCVELPIIE